MTDVLIIGGGASGLMCALTAARRGLRVQVAERMDRVGKKLLATGNGRCNLLNRGPLRYPRGQAFAEEVLTLCPPEEQTALWQELGLRLRQEEGGRVYPVTGQASSVLDCLRFACERAGAEILTGCDITAVCREKSGFSALHEGGNLRARQLVLAGGGCAQPKLGSNGSCAGLLKSLGHRVTGFSPVLTALTCDTRPIQGLSGIRVKALVSALQDEQCVYQEQGEVLFTDYGLSGVCVMNCSGYLTGGRQQLQLNFLPALGFDDTAAVRQELMTRKKLWEDQPLDTLLTGLVLPRVAGCLGKAAGIRFKDRTMASLTAAEAQSMAELLSAFSLTVTGRKGFEQAQVARGGADPREFDPRTLASRLVPGLYALGELLDVDGECGGYNLMFAFAGGILAGRALEENK